LFVDKTPGYWFDVQRSATAVKAARGEDHLLQSVRSRGPLSTELKTRLISDPIPLPELRSLAHTQSQQRLMTR
jgi:hypothetical protein